MALLIPRKPIRPARYPVCLGLLLGTIAYCAISLQTLPFLNSFWLGELPVFAVWQGPKVKFANWMLAHAVQPVIVLLGLSRSASPDHILGRPYGMALAYLVPAALITLLVTIRTRLEHPHGILLGLMLGLAALDFVMTMLFANGRFLTIY
jgi:hypothetical protein